MADSSAPTSTIKPRMGKPLSHRRHQRNIARDIKKQQARTTCILPQTSFRRLVHEIMSDVSEQDFYVRQDAIKALQNVSEDFLSDLFRESNRLAAYNGRETVSVSDMRFINGTDHVTAMEEEEPAHPASVPVL